MVNPYEVPQSVLESETLSLRKKTGWKIFFWCYLILEVVSLGSIFFVDDKEIFDIVGEAVVYSFVLVGLFAFSYNKKIAAPGLWRIVLLVLFAWDCYIFSRSFVEGVFADLNVYIIIGISIYIGIAIFLQYFALYQYAFQSKEIWGQSK